MSFDYFPKEKVEYILTKLKGLIPKVSKDPNNAIVEGDDGGLFVSATTSVNIATYEKVGIVRPDADTIILEDPSDVNNGTIKVNTEVIATQESLSNVSDALDAVDTSVPNLVPYEEDELFNIAWNLVEIEEKPEYTKEDLDAILDTIDFSGGGGGGASTWSSLKGKPFETVDSETLSTENGVLKVVGGGSQLDEMTADELTTIWNSVFGE